MKKINWDKCNGRFVSADHPLKSGKLPTPDDINIGNTVKAIYKCINCFLEILEAIDGANFKATVLRIESGNIPPEEMAVGDIVTINRQYVCSLFAD